MEVNLYGEMYEINRIKMNRYTADNTLAIQLYCIDKEYGFEEPFATLTTCLDLSIKPDDYNDPDFDPDFANHLLSRDNISFLDTNNCKWGEEFAEKYKLGKPTGVYQRSGFCEYPLYEWDINELKKYAQEG